MFTLVTIREAEDEELVTNQPRFIARFGITVRDLENLCSSKGLKFAKITQTTNIPVPQEELDFYISRGVDVIIVELN